MAPMQPRSVLYSAVIAYFGGRLYAKSVDFWGSAPNPDGGASSAFSKRMNGESSTTIDIDQVFGTLSRWFNGDLNMHIG